ncbi:MAG: Ni/Fe hydrogenase subunit alpha [Anaerolineaceae bacterium 4572_32.1]|nr:MAG: Ni/Fe hydrogenase subunit alpha [Anaerolineaceae bacterium 4572_32.1]
MSKVNVNVNVHHLTRVEGHGDIVVDVKNGELVKCEWQVVEAPRFFEAMLRGRPYQEASHITSRICGICATGHATASLRATENALGVEISEQTEMLRKLVFHGEIIDSHVLHVYMLVAPDFLGVGSVLPLATSHPEIVMRALRIKQLAGDLCAMVSGRHTHPIAMTVGGFTHLPTLKELAAMRERLVAAREDMDETIALFKTLPWPAFERETEYVCLRKDDEYAFIDGRIVTTDGFTYELDDYRKVTNEFMVPYSTAKRAKHNRESYMVGALARFNNNYDQLHPRAKAAAEELGMKPICINPYLNSGAQAVEMVHCIEDSISIIDELLDRGIEEEPLYEFQGKGGEGVGACDVPRGILFHNYIIDDEGLIQGANCVIPTNQNHANIEDDMRALVPQIQERPQKEITLMLEMLVRAYDPCISCSTHLLNVEFV